MNDMKKITKLCMAALLLTIFTGCYDRDIVDQKDFNFALPTVENLSYTTADGEVTLTWQIPNSISADFNRPLEVVVQLVVNNIYGERRVLQGEATDTRFAIQPGDDYRFIVRLQGYLSAEARQEGYTDRVLSDGVIIHVD